eukprot:TRINITY_DN775852_c0_g1_i1.p1 TRINITY_DN775852_c0_g1~~TRINITY_DN775852_c0_g1_i1.p1  ORF type:complete len:455 (-),score=116.40 TRINITY_DN775852_c0_g1_i1:106-1470(-)
MTRIKLRNSVGLTVLKEVSSDFHEFGDFKNFYEAVSGLKSANLRSLKVALKVFNNGIEILGNIAKNAQNFATVFGDCSTIPQLLQGDNNCIKLSRKEVKCLISCMFLGLFEERVRCDFPDNSFRYMFSSRHKSTVRKLRMMLEYWNQDKPLQGNIYIRRVCGESMKMQNWMQTNVPLTEVSIHEGHIEASTSCLHADFANQYIGGGVLGDGNVQEEIRFTTSTELIVSMLICERMEPNEAIIMTGSERFSDFSGYGGTLEYLGPYSDSNEYDEESDCNKVSVVAFDAIYFGSRDLGVQLVEENMLRELNKAFVAFSVNEAECSIEKYPSVATGNWGCGIFNGDHELKALIQWCAASVAKRDMCYYPFGEKCLDSFEDLTKRIRAADWTVGRLITAIQMGTTEIIDEKMDRLTLELMQHCIFDKLVYFLTIPKEEFDELIQEEMGEENTSRCQLL